MHERYGRDVEFLLVYIREAHALDSRTPMSFGNVEDPVTLAERKIVASSCVQGLGLDMLTALIDLIDDAANEAYDGWPDRLYLVGRDGKIAYAGGRGPFGFKPDELEKAIKAELAGEKPAAEPRKP